MMNELSSYFLSSFRSLVPLINPPGSAVEVLGIVGLGNRGLYRSLARKVAINTALLLAVTVVAGPYVLRCFGISIGILQIMGGLVLVELGWGMLHRGDGEKEGTLQVARGSREAEQDYWRSRTFYPLTYPITVGPCSVTVILALSTQASGLAPAGRIFALTGVMLCLIVMSILIYFCYAYAPLAAGVFSPKYVTGLMKFIPLLVLCIGAQLAWNGLAVLLKTLHT